MAAVSGEDLRGNGGGPAEEVAGKAKAVTTRAEYLHEAEAAGEEDAAGAVTRFRNRGRERRPETPGRGGP